MRDYKDDGAWLMQGDCLERMKEIPAGSVDLVLTDPPYGITSCPWDSVIPFDPMRSAVNRVVKIKSPIIFTASQPFTSMLVSSNIKCFKHEWIWEKNRGSNFGSVKYQPMKEHESVLVFSKKGESVNYYPIKEPRSGGGADRVNYAFNDSDTGKIGVYSGFTRNRENHFLDELRVPRSVQKFNTEVGLHPTQKPVALLEYLIKTYTNEGDTVLDFTMGSGSTGVACRNTNRKFIGIEMDDDYFNIAKQRISEAFERFSQLHPQPEQDTSA